MSELSDFLTQDAQIFDEVGINPDGQQIYATSRKVKCKFINRVRRYVDSNGEDIVSTDTKMYVDLSDPVKNKAKVVYGGRNYEVVHVEEQVGTVTDLQHKKLILELSQA